MSCPAETDALDRIGKAVHASGALCSCGRSSGPDAGDLGLEGGRRLLPALFERSPELMDQSRTPACCANVPTPCSRACVLLSTWAEVLRRRDDDRYRRVVVQRHLGPMLLSNFS